MQKIAHFSLSQARLANNCPLAWWYRYQAGDLQNMPDLVDNEAALQGSELDALLNDWFGGQQGGVSASEEVWRDFEAVREVHPIPPIISKAQPQVEILVYVEGITLPVLGYADLVTQDSVWEHKRGGGWDEEWWQAAKRQVALYAGALGRGWGGIVQVKEGRVHSEQFEITEALIQSVHDELRQGWRAIQGNFATGATPGKFCAMCDYETVCPYSVFKELR